jgi:iron complex transport system substrate-binding protein
MSDDTNTSEAPTRREYVKYGGAVAVGGLLAGCAGQSGSGSTQTQTDAGEGSTATETETPEDGSYSVTMEPVGEVTFESVPEDMIGHGASTEAAITLGHGEAVVNTVGEGGIYTGFLKQLPDVSFPDIDSMSGIRNEGAFNKEYVYEIDPDVIGIDPNWLLTWASAEPSDIEEVTENVAPFFGCFTREKRADDWANWPNGEYRYYSIYQVFQKWGEVFQEPERAHALNEMGRSFFEQLQSELPPAEDRPTVGLPNFYGVANDAEIVLYSLKTEIEVASGKKQYRDIGVEDAFAGIYDGKARATVDYETMLEYDPDVLLLHFAVTGPDTYRSAVEELKNDPVANELSAVQNDRIYPGSSICWGPVSYMFQTEMAAKQVYPDIFGEFPGLAEPVPEDEQLFDRQEIADIINGTL